MNVFVLQERACSVSTFVRIEHVNHEYTTVISLHNHIQPSFMLRKLVENGKPMERAKIAVQFWSAKLYQEEAHHPSARSS